MAGDQDEDLGALPPDPLLGQYRMVDDPRISITQGAAVLGKKPYQVHRLIRLGRLPRHGPPNNWRPLLLSEVEALRAKGEPLRMKDAARMLHLSVNATLELVDTGRLPLVPGTTSMVYTADVATTLAAMVRPPRRRPRSSMRRPKGPPGFLNSKQAAERLGLTAIYLTQLAAEEKAPAVFRDGQWWFDPEHIEMLRRARQARRDRSVAPPSGQHRASMR